MATITITSLNDPIAIVHIPVAHSTDYTTKLYWTLDRASSESEEFFNITSNRIEIAIFASVDLVYSEWSSTASADPEVRISASWRVFEISSGDDGDTGNYDSPHLRCVSAPLAHAGISILYQSSYFTDFLLVKEEDFEDAARIFVSQGWHVDPSHNHSPHRRSFLQSSTSPTPSPPLLPTPPQSLTSSYPSSPEITVLSTPLACVGLAKSAESMYGERLRRYLVWPERCLNDWARRSDFLLGHNIDIIGEQRDHDRNGAHSPAASAHGSQDEIRERPFISYTRTEDEASLMTEVRALWGMFPKGGEEEGVQSAGELWKSAFGDSEYDDDDERDNSDEDDEDDEDEDEDASRNGWNDCHRGNGETGDFKLGRQHAEVVDGEVACGEGGHRNGDGYYGDDHDRAQLMVTSQTRHHSHKRLSLPATPGTEVIPIFWSDPHSHSHSYTHSQPRSASTTSIEHAVNSRRWDGNPNGTARKGNSPTIHARTATPPTTQLESNANTKKRGGGVGHYFDKRRSIVHGVKRDRDESELGRGRKRCLQLDLRSVDDGQLLPTNRAQADGRKGDGDEAGVYHLDKSGLVTLFSNLLNSAHIRMLYSSTYHTANILVQVGDVKRARRLLVAGGDRLDKAGSC